MDSNILNLLLLLGLLGLATGLVLWLERKKLRLRRIIRSQDPLQVEAARSWITPKLAAFLIRTYWRTPEWAHKRAIVELLQDQTDPALPRLMLDFLRVPLAPGDEQTELAQAIALGFVDERYDCFMEYYHNREQLAQDVRAALGAHGLRAEAPPAAPPPAAVPQLVLAPPSYASAPPNPRLMLAIDANDLRTVQQALGEGANPDTMVVGGNFQGCSALLLALAQGRFEIAQYLIEQGANIHFARSDLRGQFQPGRGQTALWWAANHGHLPLVQELIRRGANVDAPDHFNGTPLSTAASAGQLAVVRHLVEQGANIHSQLTTYIVDRIDGRKPFHLAVNNGRLPVVEYLLQAGNDPNEAGGSGFTPLMTAVMNKYYDLAGFLIQHGAQVNAVHAGLGAYVGLRGYTALVLAVSSGQIQMTKMLIQAGADIHYRVPAGRNWDGKALPERGLLDFIKGKRGERIKEILQARGLS